MSRLGERLFSWRRSQEAGPVDVPLVPDELVRRLRLEASRVADATMSGFHVSARAGRGVEFAGFRSYAPGDDLRLLDRRRSFSDAGLLVRQYEVERDRALLVAVDASASMGAVRGGEDAKRRWANVLAGALVRIVAAQGDAACAALVGRAPTLGGFLRGRAAFERATEVLALEQGEAPGKPVGGASVQALESAVRRIVRESGWLVFVGDFLDEASPYLALLGEARARGAHVVAIRLETAKERDFSFDGLAKLRDPETGALLETFGPAAIARYQAARAAHRERVRSELVARAVGLVDAWTDGRAEEALMRIVEAIASQRR